MEYKKYNNAKLTIGISKSFLTFVLIFLFVLTGMSSGLSDKIASFTDNVYVHFLLFVFVPGILMGILLFPLSYYSQYILEHKYNLSNQTLGKWIWENTKGIVLSLILGIPVLIFFYYSLLYFGSLWWLPFAIGIFILSVVLARIVPVFILPLFYKVTPVDDPELIVRIKSLASDAGIKIESVFRFDMSKNTRKANAAFTGIGKSKRILLGDTLLDNYSKDEIETVIAHELGHYKKKHIIKNIIIGTASSFLSLFIIAELYNFSLSFFGFSSITEIAALPILSLWAMVIGLIQTPATNFLSRKYEYEADEYAVNSTRKPSAFIQTLKKLTDQNLADKHPHPLVEWFFYSHPSLNKRVSAIELLAEREGALQN